MHHITQVLKNQAEKYGSRDVFKYKDKTTGAYNSISWTSLYELTQQVSRALISLNYGFNDKIGIISNNKPEWTIADIGILGVRGVVVPFYTSASKVEMKYIIDETKMQLLFVDNDEQIEKASWLLENCETLQKIVSFEGSVPNHEQFLQWADFLSLSQDESINEKFAQIQSEYKKDDLATIIYTSGTTGEPKGVMLGHDNFIHAFKINYERLKVGDQETSLCFLPLSHVFERTWTFFLLYCGATNIFLENPREVINELPKVKPTLMCTVPRFFEKTYEGILLEQKKWPQFKLKIFNWAIKAGLQYIEYQKDAKNVPLVLKIKHKIANKLVFSKLRLVFGGKIKFMPCAGAAIDPKLLRFFHAAGIFINYGYGATETTATVSCFKSDIYNFNYCGSIMPGVEVKISQNDEIVIKGDTVFKGYYQKPEETAQVLKDGWFYSGDKGYIADNEYVAMTDRIKDLIKTSGGKYVSPQKLELLLSKDKYIEQIVVIGDNRKFITALIVPSMDNLKELAGEMGIDASDSKAIISNQAIFKYLKNRFDKLQQDLTPYERIITFTLLDHTFSIENKMLTNTLKIRRKLVEQQYSDLINQMYLAF